MQIEKDAHRLFGCAPVVDDAVIAGREKGLAALEIEMIGGHAGLGHFDGSQLRAEARMGGGDRRSVITHVEDGCGPSQLRVDQPPIRFLVDQRAAGDCQQQQQQQQRKRKARVEVSEANEAHDRSLQNREAKRRVSVRPRPAKKSSGAGLAAWSKKVMNCLSKRLLTEKVTVVRPRSAATDASTVV